MQGTYASSHHCPAVPGFLGSYLGCTAWNCSLPLHLSGNGRATTNSPVPGTRRGTRGCCKVLEAAGGLRGHLSPWQPWCFTLGRSFREGSHRAGRLHRAQLQPQAAGHLGEACQHPPWSYISKKKIKISQQLSRNISHLTPQNKNALAFRLFFVKNNKNKTNVLLWEVIFLPPSFTKSSQGQGGKRRVPSPGDLPSPLHAGVSHAWCQGHAYLLTHPEAWAMSAANERGLGNFITTS